MAANSGRLFNTVRNSTVELVCQVVVGIVAFICRTIFIRYMSIEYLGLNGLFNNILSILSLADLGVEIAVTYNLYKAIAEKDEQAIKALMDFLKKAFRITALFITIVGLFLIPFLDKLIMNKPDIEHFILIYVLSLSIYASKYLLAYKRTLIIADQKKYIDTLNTTLFILLQNIIQIFILLYTQNYILYLLLAVIFSVISNVAISSKVDSMYPYLTEKKSVQLEQEQKASIFKMIYPLVYRQVGTVILYSTSNIIISAFIGLTAVAMFSNYNTLILMVNSLIYLILDGAVASFGNLNATQDKKRILFVFEQTHLITFWLYGFSVVCLWTMIDPFVVIWIGEKFLIARSVTMLLLANFYLLGLRQVIMAIKDSMGLFVYYKYKPICESIINIVISLILVRFWGLEGVLLGITISQMVTTFLVDPYVLYKYGFGSSVLKFYQKFLYYVLTILLACIISGYSSSFLKLPHNLLSVILLFLISAFVSQSLFTIVFCKTPEFRALTGILLNLVREHKSYKS